MPTRARHLFGLILVALCLSAAWPAFAAIAEPNRETGAKNQDGALSAPSASSAQPLTNPVASTEAPSSSSGATNSGLVGFQPVAMASTEPSRDARSQSSDFVLNIGLGPAPPTIHRNTPRATLQGFLDASRRHDYKAAAHFVYLWNVAPANQKKKGPVLARKLAEILDRAVRIDLDGVPDNETGVEEGVSARDGVKIASVHLDHGSHAIHLTRMRDPFTAKPVWVFSASTVQSIEALDQVYGLPAYVEKLPAWTREHKTFGLMAFQWAGLILLGGLAWLGGAFLERPALWLVRRLACRIAPEQENYAVDATQGLIHWLVSLLWLHESLPALRLSANASLHLERTITLGALIVLIIFGLRLVRLGVEATLQRHINDDDPTRMRTLLTRLDAVRRIAQVLIVVVGIALGLMQFPTARTVGLSLLGSAGIAGAILGFAAQKIFANLFAGVLISFTQPVRIGDTVIVEKEWGTIEAIGATHVVVKIWDSRRLVVPVTYFLEKPFENWTKVSTELLGTVVLHADFRVDVDEFRAELDRLLDDEPLWNGNAKSVIVVDVTAVSAVLRVTVSADDASALWDLRCSVRERLLKYLQKEPSRLPRHRVDSPIQ